jgi:hypothetical protein
MAVLPGHDGSPRADSGAAESGNSSADGPTVAEGCSGSPVIVPSSLAKTCSLERLSAFFESLPWPVGEPGPADRGLIAALRALPGHDAYLDAALVAETGVLLAVALSQALTARLSLGRHYTPGRGTANPPTASQRAWVRFLTRRQGDEIADRLGVIAERSATEHAALLVDAEGGLPGLSPALRELPIRAIADEARRRGFSLLIRRGVHVTAMTGIIHESAIVAVPESDQGLVWVHSSALLAVRWLVRQSHRAWRDARSVAAGLWLAARALNASPRTRSWAQTREALRGLGRRLPGPPGVAPRDQGRDVTLGGTDVRLLTADDLTLCELNAGALAALLAACSPAVGVAFVPDSAGLLERLRVYLGPITRSSVDPAGSPGEYDERPARLERWLVGLGLVSDAPVALAIARVAPGRLPGAPVVCAVRGVWISPSLPWHERGRVVALLARQLGRKSGARMVTIPAGGGLWRRAARLGAFGQRSIGRQTWVVTPLTDAREYAEVLARSLSPQLP